MAEATPISQQAVLQRLEALGARVRVMQGSRCLLGSLRFSNPVFETPDGPLSIDKLVFATVGVDRIKCLRPRALFQLPLIHVRDCASRPSLENRIHEAWREHVRELIDAQQWLAQIGAEANLSEQQSVLRLPLAGESPETQATVTRPGEIILPGLGPLEGVALQRAEDRVLRLHGTVESSLDLEIAITNRLEELARLDRRLSEQKRTSALSTGARATEPEEPKEARAAPLLLVGPQLAVDNAAIESLRLRGYEVLTALGAQEALAQFDEHSPELVLADLNLGRSEGTELLVALRQVAGVEELPVILVDDRPRESRRDAARRVGASGYLVHPVEIPKIAPRIEQMVVAPGRRRFQRYENRLSLQLDGPDNPRVTTSIGRGGIFVNLDTELEPGSLHDCKITVPEAGDTLIARLEVLYHVDLGGPGRRGAGMRFHRFRSDGERVLIRYLKTLDHQSRRIL